MPLRQLHHVSITLGTTILFCATATAHPNHDEAVGTEQPSAFSLVQAPGPTTQNPPPENPKNSVSISIDDGFRLIKSNGWPDHVPGKSPRRGNPNKPSIQKYSFRIPIKPTISATPELRGGWWWGVALNGVPFEPGTAETWNNDRQSGWRYEAATGFLNLGLDEHNAHVQPNGSYHYHALPTGLVERLGGEGKKMLLIGWAADGFPIYSAWAYADPNDATSGLRQMKSSYRLKHGPRPTTVGGPGGYFDGRFTQDFEFAKEEGNLDECNGRTGVTPEFPNGIYYYCITPAFPFVPRKWRGVPDASFNKGENGPTRGSRMVHEGRPPRGIPEGGPDSIPTASPFKAPVFPVLTALDLDKNGILDTLELTRASQSLRSLDWNADGKLTADEYRPKPGATGP